VALLEMLAGPIIIMFMTHHYPSRPRQTYCFVAVLTLALGVASDRALAADRIHAERSPSELLRVPSDGPGDLTLSQTLDRIDRQNLSEIGTINLVGEFLETSSSEFELAEETAEPFVPARQLRDVRSTDWAFEALQSLIERYDCLAGYPDRTYRGDRAMTRYEFAAALNACLESMSRFLAIADFVTQEDFNTLQTLQEQFQAELAALGNEVDALETRAIGLESNQFSMTTKFNGISIIGSQWRTSNRGDRAPRDGRKDTDDPGTNANLINLNYLIFNTQLTPRSRLFWSFIQINGSGSPQLTNDGRTSYDFFELPTLVIGDLNYRVLLSDNLAAFVGTEGVRAIETFRGPNRVESAAFGPISFFAQRNPILNIGFGRGGVGFDWQFAKKASLQAVYSTNILGFFPNSFGGRGHNTAGVQLALTPTEMVDLTLYYINDYSPNGSLFSFVGDEQLTATNPNTGQSQPLQTHAIGGTLTWQVAPKITLGGWAGYTSSSIPGQSGRVTTTNYMAFLNILDLWGEGNLAGFYIGQPPKITSSTLPVGNNIPDFLNTGLGRSGGQPGTTIHLEAFYRWQITPNIAITPGAMFIVNPGHTPDSDPFAVGVLRTTFSF